ncbi:U7 snRNA-associated Sm-like protein LSm11 [Anopheles cruzii]|uniref:U7 snRNA-associated Sm-like protein LSm11 n=1 Tax=Anopheles cruzii TaxID=68878 RepID=UPI0022EC82C8|nr:U7 snRNA-associated Sm-like protein LSm11 [Anopheles cruzii]
MSESDSDGTSSTSGTDSSSELDATGKRFNPLKALYSAKLKVPVARAMLHDNVQTLEAKQTTLGGFEEPFDAERLKRIRAASSKKKLGATSETPKRRFAPSQGLVKVERPMRHRRNLFTRLEKCTEGPLGALKQWMDQRTRVRVYIRKQKGVGGHVSGIIELFDRHWNLAISEVEESWSRRKFRYSANRLAGLGEPQDCSDRLRQLGITLPAVKVCELQNKKYVICTRSLPKLLVKGDHVVLVTPEPAAVVKKEYIKEEKKEEG